MAKKEKPVAIVTGAARNIGRAIAVALAQQGYDILVHSRQDRAGAEQTVAAVEAAGRRAVVALADLTDAAAVEGLMGRGRDLGTVRALVNNAAVRRRVPFAGLTLEEWRAILAINLDAAFLCARACLPDMLANGWGRIVNIGGLSGHAGASERAHVVTSKAAIVGLTKALATEFAESGITANCVVPGEIETERGASAGPRVHHPGLGPPLVGRRGSPAEVARIVAMLCAPDAGFVTGQTLHVSGGAYLP